MTRTQKRPSAARRAFQFAAAAAFVSLIVGGCSSDIKTVTVDCPMGGTPSFAGRTPAAAGTDSVEMGGSTSVPEAAGEAGVGQSGDSSGGASGGVAASGGGGKSGGSGGKAGSGGRAGGEGGKGGSGGSGNTGGAKPLVCGDAVVTPPEFCDDGHNTDLSYGCSACTTLPPSTAGASQGGAGSTQQCDACLQNASKPSSCYGCVDYRACYACLRRQPDDPRFANTPTSYCTNHNRDDSPGEPDNPATPRANSDLCFNPSSTYYQPATGGPAGTKPRGLVCQALVACALRTGCAAVGGNAMFTNCYCGADPPKACDVSDPNLVPHGPCVQEVISADAPAGAPSPLTIASDLSDIQFGTNHVALAVAKDIMDCAADRDGCRDVCFPNLSGTAGAGGTSGTAGGAGTSGKPGVGGNAGHGGS